MQNRRLGSELENGRLYPIRRMTKLLEVRHKVKAGILLLGLLNSVSKPGVSERVWLLHEQIVFGYHQLFESPSHYKSPRS